MLTNRSHRPARNWWALALLILVLGLVAAIRIRLLGLPLERDEGEYAYAGQLLLQGIPPYQELYSMKWPGTYAVYALSMAVFGKSIVGIHLGLLISNLLTSGIVFEIGRRMYGTLPAAVASGTFALLSISPPTLGLAAHATHFVLLPALAGVLLLQTLNEHSRAWRVGLAGFLFGLAALMKQSGAIFGLFGLLWLLRLENSGPKRDVRRLAMRLGFLTLGGLLPLGVTCAILAKAGVFSRFWLWTVRYSQSYAGLLTPIQGLGFLAENAARLFLAAPGLWSLGILGLVRLWFDDSLRSRRFFLAGFSLFSFLSVCPGWYFREHYFLLLLPAAALLTGAGIASFSFERPREVQGVQDCDRGSSDRKSPTHWPDRSCAVAEAGAVVVFCLAACWSLFSSRELFFQASPEIASHMLYPGNAFPECVQMGRYLFEHCPDGSRIAVLGSEPELFFYGHRRSATGYVYMYPLMEPQPFAKIMQEEMIRELVAADADYYVFVGVSASWLPRPDSDLSIISWFQDYQRQHLRPIALVQLFAGDQAQYQWSDLNISGAPQAKRWIEIYRKSK